MSAPSSAKKRKVDIERRTFNPAWKEKYFFMERFGQAQCLICLKTVAVLKEFNMWRHWEAEHRASNFGSMSSAERKDAIDRLSGNLQKTTSFFRKQTAEADKIVRASYDVSRILARRMKPVSDGDFIEECLVAVVDSVCPEQRSVFESVSLSSRTVCRRIEEMSNNVHYSLKTRISTIVAFSLALDESTDTKDTAQLAVFIRGVTADLNVCEEFLQLVPLRGTTTGKDIFDAMLVTLIHRAGHQRHWYPSPWQAAPAISLICLICNKGIVICILILGFRLELRPASCSGKSHMAPALKRLPDFDLIRNDAKCADILLLGPR